MWLWRAGTPDRFLIINEVFVLDKTWPLRIILTATAIKRSFMLCVRCLNSPRIHVLGGSAPVSRWWSEILGEWHRCWLGKSNGAEFFNAATLLTVMAGASEIVLQPHNFYPLLNRHLDRFKPRSHQTSTSSLAIMEDFKGWWYISVALSPSFFCVTLLLLRGRKGKVDSIATILYEIHLVPVKNRYFWFICKWDTVLLPLFRQVATLLSAAH